MRVLVLGHKGMLGHVVARYLREEGIDVVTTKARYQALPNDPLIREAKESKADWIVNAIGTIKQKSAEPLDLFTGNALLPMHLKSFLLAGQRLIHASTDCVFAGTRGNYRTTDERDAQDVYGLSKLLGESIAENGRCNIIRTSIIGPELRSGSGLMGWFLAQRTGVNGFTNHFWNGITTLEWAKVAHGFITGTIVPTGAITQVGSESPVSKFELLGIIARNWGHEIEIAPTEAPERIDRTLLPDLPRSGLERQLQELRRWY